MKLSEIKALLDKQLLLYNQPSFIKDDPISIPHQFTKKQDIEIMGFFAAVFAWGQRTTIINKCRDLATRMDNSPHEFVLFHSDQDLKRLLHFSHRTFNDTDLLYFICFFKLWYTQHDSLEDAFAMHMKKKDATVEGALNGFRSLFFASPDVPARTRKHVSSPQQNSACKRINMYLRWMVRKDKAGVDFGIWKKIKPAQLVCPLDLHVHRVALRLGLLQRTQADWKAALELTANLCRLDPTDPVKYDLALFGMGVYEKAK